MESKTSFTICRLCLEVTPESTYETMNDDKYNMIQAIIPDIELYLDHKTKICKTCSDKISTCYEFRYTFLQNNSSHVLEDCKFPKLENPIVTGQSEYVGHDKCCFCQEMFGCLHLANASNMILEKCFLEVKISLDNKFKSCSKCLDILEGLNVFVITCTSSIQKVKEYCSTLDIAPRDVNLYEVYQFLYNSTVPADSKIGLTSTVKLEDEVNQPAKSKENTENVGAKRRRMKMFRCEVCTFETKYKSCLKSHVLKHKSPTEVEMYKCQECTYETKHERYLRDHLLKHKSFTEVQTFWCAECTYITKFKSCLKKHVLKHRGSTEVNMFRCEKCAFETKRKKSLVRHMFTHKSRMEIEMFKCRECSFETRHKSYLDVHVLKHKSRTEVEMFKCEVCTYETKRKQHLKKHLLIHKGPTEVEMFLCTQCGYTTKRKQNLTQHSLVHKSPAEVEMFKCTECAFATKHKQELKKHSLRHKSPAEVEMFKCKECKYETKYKRYLKAHSLKHRPKNKT